MSSKKLENPPQLAVMIELPLASAVNLASPDARAVRPTMVGRELVQETHEALIASPCKSKTVAKALVSSVTRKLIAIAVGPLPPN